MQRRISRALIAVAVVTGVLAGGAPAYAAPAQPAAIAESGSAGTGSALLDFPIGFVLFVLCHGFSPNNPDRPAYCQ